MLPIVAVQNPVQDVADPPLRSVRGPAHVVR